jgi:hypothetical protein
MASHAPFGAQSCKHISCGATSDNFRRTCFCRDSGHANTPIVLKHRRLTQTDAARLLGTTQAQVSALTRCRPVSISVGRLMEFLTVLGQDVEVTVKPSAGVGAGHMSVIAHQPG